MLDVIRNTWLHRIRGDTAVPLTVAICAWGVTASRVLASANLWNMVTTLPQHPNIEILELVAVV